MRIIKVEISDLTFERMPTRHPVIVRVHTDEGIVGLGEVGLGQRIYTRWGDREYLEKQALAVIQPDLALVGGITEGKKVCDYAHTYDITVQAHICGSPASAAAALHLETAIPSFLIHEHHCNVLATHNRAICEQDLQPVGGRFTVSDAPGLGVDLMNDELMATMPVLVVE